MDCLVDLIEEISTCLDQGDYAVSIFLDLSKAFDTVNHSIVLSKLLSYGIQKPHIDWFKSYLNKRKQRVFVNGNISDIMSITSGVPQGSILGPLLFLIYINDFTQSSDFFSMRLFADDTSLTASAKNIDELLFEINKELPNIYDWLCANKLTLNLRKTKHLIFHPRQKVDYNLLFPLSIAGQCLEQVSKIEYLGIYIDSHLSWHDHIDYVCDRVSKSINIMTKIKSYLGNQCYYSLVYPHLIYGSLLRGNNYDNPLSQLIRLQNKAVRIMNDVPLRDHITPHYVHLGLLNFVILLKCTIVCFYMTMSLIISRVIFHYYLYLSNMIILHEVHLPSNYRFPTQELIFESSAPTISPFIFANNNQKSCSKRHLKYIILLSIDLCVCVCECLCFL